MAKVSKRAKPAELSFLCQACGLCCDGSLFGRVDLETEEVAGARKRHLRIVGSGRSFEQPCCALVMDTRRGSDRRRCSIYEERPLSCRRFVCRLYDKYRRDGGSIEEALSVIRRVRSLLASLGQPSLTHVAEITCPTVDARERAVDATQAELTQLLEENFAESRTGQAVKGGTALRN
jgi:Fe-S-cluster containining protein